MKSIKTIGGILLVATVAFFVIGYMKSHNKIIPERPYFELGEEHIVLLQNIDGRGGSVVVDGTNTELDGIKIVVPAGAVEQETEFKIGYHKNDKMLSNKTKLSTTLIIKTDKTSNFQQFVEVHHSLGLGAFQVQKKESRGVLEAMTENIGVVYILAPQNRIVWTIGN